MGHTHHTQRLPQAEEALSVLFYVVDDTYALHNSLARCYESLKRHLSDLRQSEKLPWRPGCDGVLLVYKSPDAPPGLSFAPRIRLI